jgi:cephalosporin-C deacetylase-like acetyl esterase
MPNMMADYLAKRLASVAFHWDAIRAQIKTQPQSRERNRLVRENIRQMSGPFPVRSPLEARTTSAIVHADYRIENVIFQSRPSFFVTANLYLPTQVSGPFPAIVMPRGHFDAERMSPDYQQMYFDLVKNGFVVLAFDPIGQGERRQYWTSSSEEFDSLFPVTLEHALTGNLLALLGESSAGYFMWDGMRAIDYLQQRAEVDPERIGCADHSDSGLQAALLSAIDERIRCVAVHAGRTGHRWPIDRLALTLIDDQEQHLFPAARYGIDICDILAAIAPRPLLVLSEDPRADLASSADHLRTRYRQMASAERFALQAANVAEDWPKKLRMETVAWFCRWLRNGATPVAEEDVRLETTSALRCTKEGSLRAAGLGKSIYSLIRERAANLPPAANTPASPAEIRGALSLRRQTGPLGLRELRSEEASGLRIVNLEILSEPGIYLPCTLYRPVKTNGKIVVYLKGDVTLLAAGDDDDDDDDDDRKEDFTPQRLALKGWSVLAVDVRGIGATTPQLSQRPGRVPYQHLLHYDMAAAMMAWSLGDSLLGMRVYDVLRAVDYAARFGEVQIAGKDMGALWALFAAAVDLRVAKVVTQNGLLSYRTLLEHDRYDQASSQFVWGLLQRFDLPQVAAAIAPRNLTILDPAGHTKKPVDAETAARVYAVASSAFRRAGVPDHFKIGFQERLEDGFGAA